jgi:phage terminase large subunit-like protein
MLEKPGDGLRTWTVSLSEALAAARMELAAGDVAEAERRAKAVSALSKAVRDTAELESVARAQPPEEDVEALRADLRRRLARFVEADLADAPEEGDVVITRASTWDNKANLAPGFLAALREKWTGTAHDRQELLGELIDDPDGALWGRAALEALRIQDLPDFDRVVVAVDPPVGIGPKADACGIVAAGAYGEGASRRAVVLADASVQGLAPSAWAARAAELARSLNADCIIAEANNGGELVRVMLNLAAPDVPIHLVNAKTAKRMRAEPVSSLYDRGLVAHAAAFPALEDEMCAFGADGFKGSPDRVDALVWALTDLLVTGASPRLRQM